MEEMLKYDKVAEPQKARKTQRWKTAIGLQAIDGLQTSDYLLDVDRQHTLTHKITESQGKLMFL